ncbi:hypothetical protein AB1E18_015618 [Capra hircus]
MEATPLGLLAFLPSSPRAQTSEQGHLALCLQRHFCFSKRLTLGVNSYAPFKGSQSTGFLREPDPTYGHQPRPERGAAEREESRGGGGARARRVPSPPTVRRNPGPGEWRAAPQSNAENSRALRSGNPSRSGNQRGAQRGNAAPERSCAPTARPGRLLPSQALRPLSPQAEREIARPPPSYTPYKPA